jgi:hypothetical protein
MADHTERLPEIARAEIVIGTYPDPNSPDGRGVLVIKGPQLYSKIASGRAPILWIECDAWLDAQDLKQAVTLGATGGALRSTPISISTMTNQTACLGS